MDRALKESVAAVYETDTFCSFLRDGLHPGGSVLTRRMVEIAAINGKLRVLDIGCGKGGTPILLAQEYGCSVIGVDLSHKMIALARSRSQAETLNSSVEFMLADAEELPFVDDTFDAMISECSFSVLPNKEKAASEIARVLKPEGKLMVTDIVLKERIPNEAYCELSFAEGRPPLIPCIAGARCIKDYVAIFERAGLHAPYIEDYSMVLKKVGYQMGIDFGGWEEFLERLSSELSLCADPEGTVKAYHTLLTKGKFGYALIMVSKK
jgi:ubiquinone/menaquinone biosynthesis C-methylase UbiE